MAILEVKNLRAGYGNGAVIKEIQFSLDEGEFVTILGPNGSGKSTLIKAVQGLLRDVSGEVRVKGTDLFHLRRREVAREIAFVPQFFEPAFEFSVLDIVSMGRYVHQKRLAGLSLSDSRTINDVLAVLEIAHLRDKKIAHLSGGERQRVFMARALAQDTPLLFLDEPSAHLDINYGLEIFELLGRLQKEHGKTILCAEHNINLAIPYSQRIIFLKDGKILAQGPPAALVTRSQMKNVFAAEVEIRENLHSHLPEISLIPRRVGVKEPAE